MTSIKVLAVASEIYPLIKTGGLADVTGALPPALRRHGVETVTLVPGYPAVKAALAKSDELMAIDDLFDGGARVIAGRAAGLDLFVLDAPHLFERPGNPYTGPDGHDWPDNAFRFGALSWIAAQIGLGAVSAFVPDIVHGHDWHSGLAMAYLAYDGRRRPATVMTIHNLAFQGQFPAGLLARLRLPPYAMAMDGVEHHGAIGFLKAGLQLADRITTVSPTYAREIQTPDNGFGLDGLLRWRFADLSGIRNGIDIRVWNPKLDKCIPARFDTATIDMRAANKPELQRRFGLNAEPDRLVFGVISRMAWQKGLDILAEALPLLLETGAQLAVMGSGEHMLERRFTELAQSHSGHVGCVLGYDEDLAHLVQAGADAILIPSRFEPCGLTQLCAMHYGAIPVASKVGGLTDTIIDVGEEMEAGIEAATGLHFLPVTREALEGAIRRTAALWTDRDKWRRIQRNGMRARVSWAGPAREYAMLYRGTLSAKK